MVPGSWDMSSTFIFIQSISVDCVKRTFGSDTCCYHEYQKRLKYGLLSDGHHQHCLLDMPLCAFSNWRNASFVHWVFLFELSWDSVQHFKLCDFNLGHNLWYGMVSELLVKDKMGGREAREDWGGREGERGEEWILVGEQGVVKGSFA